MACNVICARLRSLQSLIRELTSRRTDPSSSISIDKKGNGPLTGGSYGATLTVAATDIYDVIFDTSKTPYASTVLQNLSGAGSPQLDVALRKTPPPGSAISGSSPANSASITEFVFSQSWSPEEKQAVFSSIQTLSYLRRMDPAHFQPLRVGLGRLLRGISINPDLIR